jgi:hypothetical protein
MRTWKIALGVASVATAIAACGGGGGNEDDDGTLVGGGASTGTNSGAGSVGAGGPGSGGFDPVGTGSGGAEECEAVSEEAKPKPLDMFVLLDQSGSMSGGRWTNSVAALTEFFNDPNSAGVNASLVFFGSPATLTTNGPQCNASNYNPNNAPHVPLTTLPTNASALTNAMAATSPYGYTPTLHVLQGVVPVASAHQAANPDHEVVIVVATDGLPEGCSGMTNANIYAEASTSYANGVPVYAIAIPGVTVSFLDGLANAGGTNQAIDVTQDITQFKAAMDAIRDASLGCSFSIPDPSTGTFDPDKVNVTVEHGGGSTELTQVQGPGDCANNMSWYFDDNDNPTEIILCDSPCDQFGHNEEATIQIVFGCPTVVN